MSDASRRRRSFDDLPLFYKLLLPFTGLLVVVGSFGAFLLIRNESARAQTAIDRELQEASLRVRSALLAEELSVLESVNLAANLQGVPEAVENVDTAQAEHLLRSVVALKSDLDWVALLLGDGETWVTLDGAGQQVAAQTSVHAPVISAVRSTTGTAKQPAFSPRAEGTDLVIAAPVCRDRAACTPIGVAVAGRSLADVTSHALAGPDLTSDPGVRLISDTGEALASLGPTPEASSGLSDTDGQLVRVAESVDGEEAQTLYAPLTLQGSPAGVVAVTLPTSRAFDEVRRTGTRLTLVLLTFLVGIIGVGAALSRRIMRQVKSLVATNDALGAGDLHARAHVVGRDEIGDLAAGLNTMADRLQASHENLEMRVEERTERVRELLEQRTQFFASLSHELRTPLAIVLSQAEMLMLDADSDSAKLAEPIKHSAEQLLFTVNEILDVARAEAGTLDVEADRVDVAVLLDELRPMASGLASKGHVTLTMDVAGHLPSVWADPRLLRQIVVNLLDNAVKYTPAGGGVTVSATRRNGHVELAVADTGIGIPAEVGDSIFEPFQRVEGARTQSGQRSTGLGLALVRRLVEAHHGSITYASTVAEGTTFTVCLPVTPPPPSIRSPTSVG